MAVTLVGAACAVAALACSSGHADVLSVPCTNDATATSIVGTRDAELSVIPLGTHGPGELVGKPDDELHCRVRHLLLTARDLGGDWRIAEIPGLYDGMAGPVSPEYVGPCSVPYANLSSGLGINFQRGAEPTPSDKDARMPRPIPQLLEDTVLVFKPGTAAPIMDATRRFCGATRSTVPVTPVGSYTAIAAKQVGDESIALATEVAGDSQFEMLVRRGDVIEYLVLFGEGANSDELAQIARSQDEKIVAHGHYLQPTPDPQNLTPSPTVDPSSTTGILDEVLIAGDQLPRGWIRDTTSSTYDSSLLDVCRGAPFLPRGSYTASALYAGDLNGPVSIALGVSMYENDEAAELMQALKSGSTFRDGCGGQVRNIDVTWKRERLPVAAFGDESVAWRLKATHAATGAEPDLPLISDIELDLAAIRRGPAVALIVEMREPPFFDDLKVYDDLAVEALTDFAQVVDSNLNIAAPKLEAR